MNRLERWWSRTDTTTRLVAALILLWPLVMRRPPRVILASYATMAVLMGLLWLIREPIVVHHQVSIRLVYGLGVSAFVAYVVLRIFTRLVLRDSAYYGFLLLGTAYLCTQFLILSDSRVRLEEPLPPVDPGGRPGKAQ